MKRFASPALKASIMERDAYTCYYCKAVGTATRGPDARAWNIDHVIPAIRGGETVETNLVLACDTCNKRKKDRDYPGGPLPVTSTRKSKPSVLQKAKLEGTDDYISIARAAQLAGLNAVTLRVQARNQRLQTVKLAHDLLTTRRWLHEYLLSAAERNRGRRLPLPEGYVPPDDSP